jgi:RHS repeat-associated protein
LFKVTDANSHTTQYEYDAMNRKTATIDGNGRRTETKYDLAGHAIAVTNDNNETMKAGYDPLGQLTVLTNNLGYQTQFKYDANGNQTCLIDANGLSAVTDPGHQPVNADGCTESRTYDELNRLTQTKDAQGNITGYTYNLFGNRVTLTDAQNHVTTLKYDDLGRLIEAVDPLIETLVDKTETFVYDEAGNLIQKTDRKGQVNQYSYDSLNRNTQTLHLVDNSIESTFFDNFGDLTQTQNANVTYTYAYNALHQPQSKTDSRLNKSESWTFDPVGNIDTKTDYQGDVTKYQYDSANRLTAETNPAYLQASYHYDDAGRLLDRILSNGAKTHYRYDNGGRLTQLQNTGSTGQLVNNTGYVRDRIGNILTQTETDSSNLVTGTINYNYDPEYRLLTANYGTVTTNNEAYSYDKVGNRLTSTLGALVVNATSRYYNYNAGNRLTDIRIGSAIGTVYESYGYDDNGSMTGISGNRSMTLTWDANNRPTIINGSTFNYDPSGYRIKKSGTTNNNYYLEGENLEAIYDNTGTVQAKYLRGSVIDEIINGYQLDATGKLVNYTYHHDALQSVLGQSGHEGSILAKQTYSSFGSLLSQTGLSNNTQKYTGREIDKETGLYNYRNRIYDPAAGRFISEDLMGFSAGINFYTYCFNNPIICNDPSGDIGVAGALIGGGVDLGLQLLLNGGDFSDINYVSIGVSSALGLVGYVGGGSAAKSFLSGANIGTKGIIGEFGAAIKGLGQGRIPIALQQDYKLSKSYTVVDQIQKNILTGKNTLVEAKYSTSGKPSLRTPQRLAVKELPAKGFDYRVVTTVPGEVINAAQIGSAAMAGAVNSAMQSINVLSAPQVPLGTLSVDFLGFGNAASGGYVLYPSKPNNNMAQAVYHK